MLRYLLPLLLLLIASSLHAQTIRVMTYNVLQFGAAEDPARVAAIGTVIDSTMPDILCVQEIQGPIGYFAFHAYITGPRGYQSAGFLDGRDNDDDVLFFREGKVEVLRYREVVVDPRPAHVYTVHILGTTDTIDVAVVHLKTGDTPDDAYERGTASAKIRGSLDTLSAQRHRIVAGDFNVYSSSENAYRGFTTPGVILTGDGQVVDPLNRPGRWSSGSSFVDIHTQSTRTDSLSDGGGTGGMNHRFDQILVSPSLLPTVIQGSYRTLGQDGNHFNKSLLDGLNAAVSPELAQALYTASDHLPVLVDLDFAVPAGVKERRSGEVIDLTEAEH